MRLLLLLAALLPLPASALEQVALQLKWKHQFQFAGYYAAQEKGYYRDAGLEVSVIEAGPETDPVREVLDAAPSSASRIRRCSWRAPRASR